MVDGEILMSNSDGVVKVDNQIVSADDLQPEGQLIILRPNKYDPNRANLAVFNWNKALAIQIDVSEFLSDGEKYVLKDPKHFFGDPVHWGYCEEGKG